MRLGKTHSHAKHVTTAKRAPHIPQKVAPVPTPPLLDTVLQPREYRGGGGDKRGSAMGEARALVVASWAPGTSLNPLNALRRWV